MSRGGTYNGDCQEFFKESKLYISKQSQLIQELETKLEELSEQRWHKINVFYKGLLIYICFYLSPILSIKIFPGDCIQFLRATQPGLKTQISCLSSNRSQKISRRGRLCRRNLQNWPRMKPTAPIHISSRQSMYLSINFPTWHK